MQTYGIMGSSRDREQKRNYFFLPTIKVLKSWATILVLGYKARLTLILKENTTININMDPEDLDEEMHEQEDDSQPA